MPTTQLSCWSNWAEPAWVSIVQFTPRVPLFVGHLLFGATVGAFVAGASLSRQQTLA